MGSPKVNTREPRCKGQAVSRAKRDLPPPDKGPDQAIDLDRLVWDPEYRDRIRSAWALGT